MENKISYNTITGSETAAGVASEIEVELTNSEISSQAETDLT